MTAILDDGVDCARQSLGGAVSRPLVSPLDTTLAVGKPDHNSTDSLLLIGRFLFSSEIAIICRRNILLVGCHAMGAGTKL